MTTAGTAGGSRPGNRRPLSLPSPAAPRSLLHGMARQLRRRRADRGRGETSGPHDETGARVRLQRRRSPTPHPGPLHAEGQKRGSVGQSCLSASRRLRSASRALCASHVSRVPRAVQHIGRPAGGRRLGRWVRRGDVGVRGRGRGPHRCRRWRVCAPREEVPLHGPADGFDPFGMRHTGRARGRSVVRCGGIGHRLLSLDTEPVGAFDAVECEREAGEVLRRHRLRALAEVGHRAERQRSQGLDCDEGAKPFGTGLPCALPFLGKAVGLALQADQAVDALGPAALGGSRPRAASCARDQRRTLTAPRTDARHDLVHGSAVLDRCSHGVLDCGRLRLVR